MQQVVNLYRDGAVLRAPRLDALRLVQLLGAGVAALIAISGVLAVHASVRDAALVELRERVAATQRGTAELELRVREHTDASGLEARIARLDLDARARERLLELLNESASNRQGFSEQLAAIGRARVDGMWLESFALRAGGSELELRGRALRPELVPRFVSSLGAQASMAGAEFGELVIRETPGTGGALHFEIRSRPEEDPG